MNQQQFVSTFHIMFERLHNLYAKTLKRLNPHWDSEKTYQEARKINIGRWQFFYFGELSNSIIDEGLLRSHGVHIDQLMAKPTIYNPKADFSNVAELTHSHFRAHVLVPNPIEGREFTWIDSDPYYTEKQYLNFTVNAHFDVPVNPNFPFPPALAQNMFQSAGDPIGLSMVFINLQRGRDVGLPNLRTLTEWAFNRSVENYDDLAALNIHPPKDLALLESVYPNVEDIDIWASAFLEKRYGSGSASYTHQRMRILNQQSHIEADRFFFSHENVFKPEQRAAIYEGSSISQMMCEVFNITEVPTTPLRMGSVRTKCSSFKPFDFSKWIES